MEWIYRQSSLAGLQVVTADDALVNQITYLNDRVKNFVGIMPQSLGHEVHRFGPILENSINISKNI